MFAHRHTQTNDISSSCVSLHTPSFVLLLRPPPPPCPLSDNKVNGFWSCENPDTLAGDLKQTLGYRGFVMSDWGATHSTSIMAGLDMEMPQQHRMNPDAIKAGIAAKNITRAAVDDAVLRILRAMFAVGVMDEPARAWDPKKLAANVTTDASLASARRLAAGSTVLLKNDAGVLPLPKGKHIALLGFVGRGAVVHGGGSGGVVASYIVSPRDGIGLANTGGKVSSNNGTDLAKAAAVAAKADYAIVFVGTLSHEGYDRESLSLDDGCEKDPKHPDNQCEGNAHNQNALVEAVAAANPNTIVVMSVPGAILTPWAGKVKALLTTFMPGQQAGNAIADILFGAVNPSGRLPLTFPNKENEQDFTPAQWPGLPDPTKPAYANYTEKLLFGYRYYDHHNITFTTGFPFGHGLSYTSFAYKLVSCDKNKVVITVENTGTVPGQEVAQLYLGFPAAAGEPVKQLKGFQKVPSLAPGSAAKVAFSLTARDRSIWSVTKHAFVEVPGTFAVHVGGSSRDIRLTASFTTSMTSRSSSGL